MAQADPPRQRWKPTICRDCLTAEPPISARGLCVECAIKRQTKSAVQQAARSGPYYEAWKAKMRELGQRF